MRAEPVLRDVGEGHNAALDHLSLDTNEFAGFTLPTGPDGYVKVLDFGLAKLMESSLASAESDATTAVQGATKPGTVLGTVH